MFSTAWGLLSTVVGNQYRGGFLSTAGGCSVPWGYHDKCGGYLEYRGGYHEYRGGYLEYCGGTQYCGEYHVARVGYHEYRGGKIVLFEYPHGTEHLTVLMISSMCIMISSTVLSIIHGTDHPAARYGTHIIRGGLKV